MKHAMVTGCFGNLGVYVCKALLDKGYHVIGIDNDGRAKTLGDDASVFDNMGYLIGEVRFEFIRADISDINWDERVKLHGFIFPDVIVHCAAQVSHPRSIEIPIRDFWTNAYGTLNLLEFCRKYNKQCNFIHIGTAKIYGQNVDHLWPYDELDTRYWYTPYIEGKISRIHLNEWTTEMLPFNGVSENCSFDQTLKTPFGVSKACADLYVQEYGKLYGLQTSVLRPGVFTGKYAKPSIYQNWVSHKMQEMLTQEEITIIGWFGKQVRDVLHCEDLTTAIMMMVENPPPKGEVYNIGGGMNNAISVWEAIVKMERLLDKHCKYQFAPTREGDWCVYVTDNSKLMKQYPDWKVTKDLDFIFEETLKMLQRHLVQKDGK